jgi:hypothetical protein
MPSPGYLQADWRREAIRTNLWVVPATEALMVLVLFAGTYAVDRTAYHGDLHLPSWVLSGTADSARQILTAVAAAVITVVGIVFSITIPLSLTLSKGMTLTVAFFDLSDLYNALSGIPDLAEARCVGRHELYDSTDSRGY